MIAQTPQLFSDKNYLNWLINVEDKSVLFSVYSMTEVTKFLVFMFPQVVQRH